MVRLDGRFAATQHGVDEEAPTLLDDDGQVLTIFIHDDVPLRDYITSHLDSRNVVTLPLQASHILLDLLSPLAGCRGPTPEEQGFINHRDHRFVISSYWAVESIKAGRTASMGYWDLSGWEIRPQTAGSAGPSRPALSALPSALSTVDGVDEVRERTQVNGNIINGWPGVRRAAVKRGVKRPRPATERSDRHGRSDGRTEAGDHLGPSRLASDDDFVQAAEDFGTDKQTQRTEDQDNDDREEPAEDDEDPVWLSTTRPTPTESAPRSTDRSARKTRPGLSDQTPSQVLAQYTYFLTFAQTQLNGPPPDQVVMGTVDTVKQWMILRVHAMWVEARRKYSRRNLDTMSVMLSTWRLARDFNLSPRALRNYYTLFKNKIILDKGPYVPVDQRPPGWPFHQVRPENPEAGIPWIHDWGSKEADEFIREHGLGGPAGPNGGPAPPGRRSDEIDLEELDELDEVDQLED